VGAFVVVSSLASEDAGFVKLVQQRYTSDSNNKVIQQIQYELTASYVYQAYGSYFGRADIALPGFQKFFNAASKEEKEHAQKLIDYVNLRGGHVTYDSININDACEKMKHKDIFGERTHACICEFAWTKSDNECKDDSLKTWDMQNKWGLMAMEDALSLERFVNDELLKLHKAANDNNDVHLSHLIEHEFLDEQVNSIRQLAGYVTRLRSFSSNYALGEYMFDQKL